MSGIRITIKNLSNQVVASYPDGEQQIIFHTTEPHLVYKELEDVLLWTNSALETEETHPIITISTLVYNLLSIQPFQDGNGRSSRLLTTLLLLRSDYQFILYVSFENIIEERKSDDYRVLMEEKKDRYSDIERIDAWLLLFFDCLVALTLRLEAKYNSFKTMSGYLNDRKNAVLEFTKINQPVKVSDVIKALPEYSMNTIRKDLIYIRDEKVITSIGAGRGTMYVVASGKGFRRLRTQNRAQFWC